jgi:Protein of unknown function (DUF3572)
VVADDDHAQRLLALTGITPDELRMRLMEPEVLIATLDFILAHEPDLLACAQAIGTTPQALEQAHAALSASGQPTPDWGA